MNKKIKNILKSLIISVVIIGIGILISFLLIKFKREPERVKVETIPPLVTVTQVTAEDKQMIVSGYGTVEPKLKVEIVPQVDGKIVSINPEFKKGGFIPAGEELFKLDPKDYQLEVQQAQAAVAEAEVKLDIEQAEAKVAKEEWKQLNPGKEPDSPLVFRDPQIRQAKAQLESAKAKLQKAKLKLERTNITLPHDIRIVEENVDMGQYVSIGQNCGSAYGTQVVEIPLPLEDDELQWISIPDTLIPNGISGRKQKGSEAIVKSTFAGRRHAWKGYISRVDAEVNQKSRMVTVYIEVPDAFETKNDRPALLPGMFVEVNIKGKVLENSIAVPRDAIHGRNKIWVSNDGKLEIKEISIKRADQNFAYVTNNLNDGDKVILTSMDTVVEGMKVRTQIESSGGMVSDANLQETVK